MRIVLAASTAATIGLIASGALGVAGAETTPTTTATTVLSSTPPPRTVGVQGVATEPIDPNASAATATAVYRQGMSDAVSDGLAKAQFLAGKGGATLGPIQSMSEGGGYIGCAGDTEYQGEQPDFGSSGGGGIVVGARAPEARPVGVRKPAVKHRRHHTAKKAAAAGCTLSTQVSLVYSLS